MKVDYLIIGQGIAGTLLSYELLQSGKSVMVLDDGDPNRSSLVAGAVINPMAGKHWTPSADAQRFIPEAINTYRALETLLDIKVLTETDLLVFHENENDNLAFEKRQEQFPGKIYSRPAWSDMEPFFNNRFDAGKIDGLWLVAAAALSDHWCNYLKQHQSYRSEKFDQGSLGIQEHSIIYKDIIADKIIFCEGAAAADNPLFKVLPFTKNRGEALLLHIPGLPQEHIYHRGVRLVPKDNEQFWCGSNYKWNFSDLLPDEQWKKEALTELQCWLKIPFTIKKHIVAQRPTTAGQIPLIGTHPQYGSVAIFNGLGTRGFSAGPFWAGAFADMLCGKTKTVPEYDQARFQKFFS